MANIKAREIREMLGNKLDPAVVKILCMMADEISQLDRAVNELAVLMDKMIDQTQLLQNAMGNITQVLDNMPSAQKILKRLKGTPGDQGGDDGHGSH